MCQAAREREGDCGGVGGEAVFAGKGGRMKARLYIVSPTERDTVLAILGHNGYVVCQGKEKAGSKTLSYVEYWREETNAN